MLIVYDTHTGNTRRFVKKLNMECQIITPGLIVEQDFILVTYTVRFGEIPNKTLDFLKNNHIHLKGVASSGNRNWGKAFANAANVISLNYSIPIIHQFELSGSLEDVKIFHERCKQLGLH